MSYKRSEVFENYIKISKKNGLISDEDMVKTAESMTQEEKYRNKEWKDTIQMLYNLDINKDKEDILDRAHPKSVIIAPAYDKLNGLVENLKERHNIMVGIALKPNNGLLTNHKYAQAKGNLLKNLIRLGYEFDNKNIDDVRKMADSCSERLVKNAFAPLLIAGGVALVAGIIALINNTTPSDQGILANLDRAEKWVSEAREGLPQLSGQLGKLEEDLMTLKNLTNDYMNLDPIDASTVEKFKESAAKDQSKFDAVKKYKRACQIMSERLPKYIDMLRTVKTQESSWGDFADKLVDIYRAFDPDDAHEAALALETLQKSLTDSVKEAAYFMNQAKEQEPTLTAALTKSVNDEGTEAKPYSKPEAKPSDDLDAPVKPLDIKSGPIS